MTSLLLNFCLLIACAFGFSLTYREWPVRRSAAEHTLRLVLAAGTTWLLAVYSMELGPFRVDLRYVPVALVTLYFGPLRGALVAAPMLVWRLLDNADPGVAPVVVLHFLSVLGLSTLLRSRLPTLQTALRWRDLWLTALPFLGVGWGMLLTPEGREAFALSYPLRLLLGGLGLAAVLLILQSRLRLLHLAHTLRTQAHTDPLTGLPNRRQFDRDLAALGTGGHLALLDLDHFKAVNDRYGHSGGDRALRQVAGLLRDLGADGVQAYRVGGEEFALLAGAADRGRLGSGIGKLRVRLGRGDPPWGTLTLSAGLATRLPAEAEGDLLRRADEALYLAKTNGRDQLVVWTPRPAQASPAGRPVPTDPPQPRHSVWQALRTTVGLLAGRRTLSDEDWAEVLSHAVNAVDGAGCGTLDIREGRGFRVVAAHGYGPGLVGLTLSEASQQRWYGGSLAAWRAGEARVVRGESLARAYAESDAELDSPEARLLSDVGRRQEVRASLCLPVVLEGEVVAHLNLDALAPGGDFGPQAAGDAVLFAQQIAALLHLQERWNELSRLVELHTSLGAAPEGTPLEDHLTRAAQDLLRAKYALLLRHDDPSGTLHSTGTERHDPPLGPVELPRGQGLAWAALTARRVLRVPDLQTDPRIFRRERLGGGAMMAVPLLSSQDEPLGALILIREPERPFGEADEHLALLLGSLAARLLERDAHLGDLRATLDAALETLGVAVELRDFETQGHTERVTHLALTFGAALGLPAGRLLGLRQGAALHDIGKLGVPDAVLLKPGRLTPEERLLIETHAPRGAELAARIPFLHPEAHGVVRSHHERWDGTGYPDGLRGEGVPLLARIFALCDVYDALTSDRPYRAALSPEEALAILEAGRGTQFDPALTDRFVALQRAGRFGPPGVLPTRAPCGESLSPLPERSVAGED
ncbi:diguanylate cyclase [Deinococcus sp. SDU3-2]|uniref:Diguanylate cyclase n=1 Tax=Deinococcus terrestris TaxID=2651870 RepID=A0A7X1TSK6_9DEIO|nr:HD domain-containing phosphohydrolase [Deinococcus terrestris]MPY67556.1 diguanylate cyclase [Deinococcus terrestris]